MWRQVQRVRGVATATPAANAATTAPATPTAAVEMQWRQWQQRMRLPKLAVGEGLVGRRHHRHLLRVPLVVEQGDARFEKAAAACAREDAHSGGL